MADSQPAADDASETRKVVAGTHVLRSRIATLLWLVAVVCALFLAVAALLVTLRADPDNTLVKVVEDGAHALDLGVFSPEHGPFTPSRDPSLIQASLINWGLGSVAYLVVAKILDRLIRPRD